MLDIFTKKTAVVLEKDHEHEMSLMPFLAQLIKDGPVSSPGISPCSRCPSSTEPTRTLSANSISAATTSLWAHRSSATRLPTVALTATAQWPAEPACWSNKALRLWDNFKKFKSSFKHCVDFVRKGQDQIGFLLPSAPSQMFHVCFPDVDCFRFCVVRYFLCLTFGELFVEREK